MRKKVVFTSLALAFALAATPRVRAQEAQRGEGVCPRIVAGGPPDSALLDDRISFRARHAPQRDGARVTYDWKLSAGTIVGGQGTDAISTDLAGFRGEAVEVTLGVGGLPGLCPTSVTYTLPPRRALNRLLDPYGNIRFGDEKARLDGYARDLRAEPTAQGYIICYGGRVGRAGEASRRCRRAAEYMYRDRRIEASRVVTADGGYREELTVELWIVPSGAPVPTASPTVDPSEVKLTEDPPRRARKRR